MVVFYEVVADFPASAAGQAVAVPANAAEPHASGQCPGPGPQCAACEDRLICHCLQVYESTLLDAVESRQMMTVNDIIRETGAGGGCTACHRRLRRFLKTTI